MNQKDDKKLLSIKLMGVSGKNSEERLECITSIAIKLLDTPISLVAIVDKDNQWLRSAQGLSQASIDRTEYFCSVIIENKKPLIVNDLLKDLRFFNNHLVTNDPWLRAYAGYPVKLAGNEVAGTVSVFDTEPREFDASDLTLLEDIAAIVEDELRIMDKATTDALTGILNRHSFTIIADEELQRAQRDNKHFCIILINLNNFRLINSEFGDAEGDIALQVFSKILEQQSNAKIIAARMGESEFAILLADLLYDDAINFINNFEDKIDSFNELPHSKYKLEFSYGITEYDDEKHAEKLTLINDAEDMLRDKGISSVVEMNKLQSSKK